MPFWSSSWRSSEIYHICTYIWAFELDQKCPCNSIPYCSYFPCIAVHMEPPQSPQAVPSSDGTKKMSSAPKCAQPARLGWSLTRRMLAVTTGTRACEWFSLQSSSHIPYHLPGQRQATFSQMILKDFVLNSWNPLARRGENGSVQPEADKEWLITESLSRLPFANELDLINR